MVKPFLRRFAPALVAVLGFAAPLQAETFVVQAQSIADYRPVFGTVESLRRAEARVRLAGTLVSLDVVEGDEVQAGQELARVVDDKLALELEAIDASLRALDAQAALARTELERIEELRRRGAVSVAQLDDARTNLDVVEQNRAARRAERAVLVQRQAEGAVLAPEAGRVLQVPVTEAMAVQPGETVAVIATRNFVLRTRLPERHARYLAVGDAVRIAARGMLSADSEGGSTGRIVKVYPELEAGRVVVDVEAPGLGDFFVGERIRLDVATGERPALVVPEAYLTQRFGVTFARLDGIGEVVVQPGQRLNAMVEVLAGLAAGDRLVPYGN
ncbi:MAG: efflux RND transporter periplasmic adaptor subunit [Geminicoccaceae bacterium]|nr:MAG: efflux RND transporter periplasmic adaptor subunit [Geminicoccaceae bacterium]